MAYTDPVKLAAEAAAKAVRESNGKKTPDPAASVVGTTRASDLANGVSKPYSFLQVGDALQRAKGAPGGGDFSKCKYELDVHERLKGMFGEGNGPAGHTFGSVVVPTNTAALRQIAANSKDERFAVELHERVKGFDANQGDGVARTREKAMSLSADEDGGILRGEATLGDLVEYMRNTLVFAKAGATSITLPANGLMKIPKQTGTTSSYWEGEGFAVGTESQMKFGTLDLVLKKQYSRATITNEMTRFGTVDGEAMLRKDMAESAARNQDKTMLQGLNAAAISGGAKAPRGLITYGRASSALTAWAEGQDYLIEYTASTVGANGNTLEPQDIALMLSKLPDAVQESDNLKFVGRNDFFAAIKNRRADAVTAGDAKGHFLFDMLRDGDGKQKKNLSGYEYVGSSQVSNTRAKGAATNLTYLVAGDFSHWVIAELPVAEFLANPYSSTAFDNDATSLRMIRFVDGGPRNASAFVLCDSLLVA